MGLGFDEPTDADMDSTNSDADETIDTDEDDNSSVESGMSSDSNSLLLMSDLESVASDTSIDVKRSLCINCMNKSYVECW